MDSKMTWTPESDWFWEGNVQKKIVGFMNRNEGFEIISTANTQTKERGPDILAEKGGVRRIVSVKGYPSDKYTSGPNMGRKKPTQPTLQAKHWFAEAVFDLIRAKSARPEIEIALGFPKIPRYVNLLREVQWFRETIGLLCYFVGENGEVEVFKPSASV
jgi:hypothetical protein